MATALKNFIADENPIDLSVQLGRLRLKNPVMVASGTFGYAREMADIVDLRSLGGILPKTITRDSRAGNAPWRTVEVSSGLLNAIGLDNDGIDYFIANHWPYLNSTGADIVVSIAGKSHEDFVYLAQRLAPLGLFALELNVSCPNVSGGIDFGTDAQACFKVVSGVRNVIDCPILTKLTPNVTSIATIAKAAYEAGTDAVTCINTVLGMSIDWRRRKPMLANTVGGMSGPAIKPVALRCVHQVASAVPVPIVGVGGIATIDDLMEFIVAGASAIQIGTANYYDPLVSVRLIEQLPSAVRELGYQSIRDCVRTLQLPTTVAK
ncbi:MAG: dihydroorotate dehydrogenase [Planctomycetaceae bacterium]|jgi:dihydroorotate dehydrogenase (NAD+) catalytic subunit|nr:dihydroorotate dehydrogenase [Planctomycetaceae bacterium]